MPIAAAHVHVQLEAISVNSRFKLNCLVLAIGSRKHSTLDMAWAICSFYSSRISNVSPGYMLLLISVKVKVVYVGHTSYKPSLLKSCKSIAQPVYHYTGSIRSFSTRSNLKVRAKSPGQLAYQALSLLVLVGSWHDLVAVTLEGTTCTKLQRTLRACAYKA
jgi:hypothetical protein